MTLIEALLVFAVVVVVPAAVPLHPAAGRGDAAVALGAGVPAVLALLLDRGWPAALLAVPWLAGAVVGVVLAARWWWRSGRRPIDLVWVVAAAYLVVGAVWLVADRLDLEPAGFAAPFVQLTAIHFHYAGFAASVLTGCAWRWRPGWLAAAAVSLVVASPPIVAIGFTTLAPLQIAGAVLLTIGVWALAWETARRVEPARDGLAGVLLVVSSLATLAPMALAVQWAIGTNYGTPALSIPDMARLHGVTNALGFVLVGVWGWRRRLGV